MSEDEAFMKGHDIGLENGYKQGVNDTMSVIEDIKAEIEDYFAEEYEYCKDIPPYKSLIFEMGHKVIDIIDKHTKGDTDADSN